MQRITGPYYYGRHKWDNYLLDIQDTIKAGAQEQAEELRQQTRQLQRVQETLDSGLEALRAEFEWGFSLMVDRLDRQIEQLSTIAAKLDVIHKTLQSPLLTQARELFQLGQEHFRKGLLDKALDAYLRAEEKNEVDFPLQLQIGKLFLYGRDEDDDVIDLPKAEKHLLLAARYADAEKGTFPQWNDYCGQAYFHAAVAAYLIGEQQQADGLPDSMRACLERALGYLSKASKLWPQFTETLYTQAKCYSLLGQPQEALERFKDLSDRDRRYCAKAGLDRDFDEIRARVTEVFAQAVVVPGPIAVSAKAQLAETLDALGWAKKSSPESPDPVARLAVIEEELRGMAKSLDGLDVDVESLQPRSALLRKELMNNAEAAFEKRVQSLKASITERESERSRLEAVVSERSNALAEIKGGVGMGCLFSALGYFVPGFALEAIFSMLPNGKQLEDTAVLVGVCVAVVGFFLGFIFSRARRRRPLTNEIQSARSGISEWDRVVAPMVLKSTKELEALQQQRNEFFKWRTNQAQLRPASQSS